MTYQYDYPRPAVSVDLVVLDRTNAVPKLLLIERLHEPYANHWALPGGFMEIDETLEAAAARELAEETGLVVKQLQQFGAFSAVHRDPRGRVITVAFVTELPTGQVAIAADDAKRTEWFSLHDLPPLAFDHGEIVRQAPVSAVLINPPKPG